MQLHIQDSTHTENIDKPRIRVKIRESALQKILRTVGTKPPETGGSLAIDPETGIIEDYVFDGSAITSHATYSPDIVTLNRITIPNTWIPRGLKFRGFVHSHPGNMSCPSHGDYIYAERILRAMDSVDMLFMPIVLLRNKSRSRAEIYPYVAFIDDNDQLVVQSAKLTVMKPDATPESSINPDEEISELVKPLDCFARIENAVSLDRMGKSRMIAIGTGGSRAFIEEMARSGLGELVLIDPDVVSITNIATQNVYSDEVGIAKTSAIKAAVKRINPNIRVLELTMRLEQLDDQDIKKLIRKPLPESSQKPHNVLLCGMTDNFETQARVNNAKLD